MTEQRVLLQAAYVLHMRPYRDSSALVELFSREHGRIGVVAKGVRSARSRWRGVLQVFQPLLVSWTLRGDLGTLTGAENDGPNLQLPADKIASGFYLNEILMRLLTRHDGHEVLFREYDATLRAIAGINAGDTDGSGHLEILLRGFEKHLLAELGYGLVLDHDIESGQAIQAMREYYYFLERGPVAVEEAAGHPEEAVYSGRTLLALQSGDLSEAGCRQEAKRLLRTVLGHYLGSKPLLSRQLMRPGNALKPTPTTPQPSGAMDNNAAH